MYAVFFLPRCAIPGLQNDTYEVQDKNHAELISLHIPQHLQDGQLKYSRCYLYGNETLEGNETQHKCNSWVYDKSVFQTSITSDVSQLLNNCSRSILERYFRNCVSSLVLHENLYCFFFALFSF